jgi:excisionase family DNA binding protein
VVQAEGVGSGASATVGPYLSAREVANRLRLSIAIIYRLCETGKLPHVRVLNAIRVGEGDLRTYLRNRRPTVRPAEGR